MAAHAGRHKAHIEGDFVVFLIGFHVNRPWAVRQWWPVFTAMGPMIAELRRDPGSGLLGVHTGWMFGGPALVQYWRSFAALEAYAREPDAHHLPAWRRFNKAARGSHAVGIFHETYQVRAGEYEALYVDMPRIGLARAADLEVVGSDSTAAQRIGQTQGG